MCGELVACLLSIYEAANEVVKRLGRVEEGDIVQE